MQQQVLRQYAADEAHWNRLIDDARKALSKYAHQPLTDYASKCRITLEDDSWAQEEDDFHITINRGVFERLPDQLSFIKGIIVHNFLHTISSSMWTGPIRELKQNFTVGEVDMYEEMFNSRYAYLIHPELSDALVQAIEGVRVAFGGEKTSHRQLLESELTASDIHPIASQLHKTLWEIDSLTPNVFVAYILIVSRHKESLNEWWGSYWMF